MTIALATRRMRSIVLCCLVGFCTSNPAFAQISGDKVHLDIPAQSLSTALTQFGRETGTEIVFTPDAVSQKVSAAIKGDFAKERAIALLLAGTGLTYRVTAQGAIVINAVAGSKASGAGSVAGDQATRVAQSSAAGQSQTNTDGPQNTNTSTSQSVSEKDKLSEIVVTGTHIRGAAPVGSAITIYSREDLDQSGAATVDQFARTMTENFSSVDGIANGFSNAQFALFPAANAFSGASFDLHGIGPQATLTLLNGQRLAPAGIDGSLSDTSMIPLSAIDHIEVLNDGASAIYGTDAVAGVVNIITRKDFDGAETTYQHAAATQGGAIENTASQLLGHAWTSGNVLFDYEYDDQGGLDASQRDYIAPFGGPNSLIPESRRNSVFLIGNQSISSNTNVSGSASYSERNYVIDSYANSVADSFTESVFSPGTVRQYGGTLTLDQALFRDWHAVVTGNYSRIEQSTTYDINESGSFTSQSQFADTDSIGVDASLTGGVFSLPAGLVKAALGISYRKEGFDSTESTTSDGTTTQYGGVTSALERHVRSVYGELFIPVVGPSNELFGVRRLELSASARYDDYSDFGSTTNPKVGFLWELISGIDLRGSYGTSFRAPLLSELGALQTALTRPAADPTSPTGSSDLLELGGGNPDLRPENSRSYTVGLDFKPEWIPTLSVSATYFHIVYDDRVTTPPLSCFTCFLTDPQASGFVTRNPPLSLVESYFNSPIFEHDFAGKGPGGVSVIFDNEFANIATTRTEGIDFSEALKIPTDHHGSFVWSSALDLLLKNEFQPIATLPASTLLNTYGEPTKWKGRTNLAWTGHGFTASGTLNFVGSYNNTLFVPEGHVASWTTADMHLSYSTGESNGPRALHGIKVSLNLLNIADRRPPYAPIPPTDLLPGVPPIPFDSTNASPVGRLLSVQIAKRW
jgi:iron complex outermembrane recepter protein